VRPRAGLGRTAGRALRAAACDADAARSGPGIGSEARAWRAQRYVCHAVGNIAAQAPAWAGRFAEPAFAGALLAPAAGGAGEAVRADALAALARLARHHPAVLVSMQRAGLCARRQCADADVHARFAQGGADVGQRVACHVR